MEHEIQPSAEVVNQVNELMAQGFEISKEKLVPAATLMEDLGLDSLDAVDMVVHIEDTLGVRVEGERLRSMKTLQDVYVLAAEALQTLEEDHHLRNKAN